ncbi:MAG TPA: hypothetical protein VFD30_04085 [Terriglobia bacterium]|nr:hypothetical protein [Terriglobia bacterium]
MSDAELTGKQAAEEGSEIQHEVCGFTGTSASRAVAEMTAPSEPKRETAQVTMSAIGDVAVAASETVGRVEEASKVTRWKPVVLFTSLVYLVSLGFAWLLKDATPEVRFTLVPLVPALLAGFAFWWRQRWKFKAKDWQYKLKIWQDALDSVQHEAVNAVNAIRAQLIGFRIANPQVNDPEHLDILEEESRRIDAVVQRTADPVAWKESRKKKKVQQATPSEVGEDTRSRIAL